jgi:RNA polymerase sigma-70 factor (ECF subfamily)
MSSISKMLEKVRRTVVRRGVQLDEADDIVQEAFARMESYMRAHVVENKEAFLMQVAMNISRDQAKRRRGSPISASDLSMDLVPDAGPKPDEIVRAQERLRRAKAGLDQLDVVTRRCLLDQRLGGLTFAQIAEREGLPTTTVEKRVARAILFLTKWMDGW